MSSERRPDISGALFNSQEQQQSGMPPMGMPPQQDGPSQRSGEPSYTGSAPYPPHYGAPGGEYGGGPPPPPQPYAAAQQPQSYQPLPPGSFPQQGGFPPYGMFPHHMFHPGAPPPYGQQPPFYGFPGYPAQHQQSHDEKSGGRRKSPTRRNRSPRRPYNSKSIPDEPQPVADMPSVKPMQSAFHFFVQETMDSLRQAAEEEVRKTNNGQLDLYLVNTNLNSRLIKEWEDASQIVREAYMEKEEEDRKRFMADDEIASRHCATLTARARSPQFGRSSRKGQLKEEEDDEEEDEGSFASGESDEQEKKRDSSTENDESPPKKLRTDSDEVNGEEAIAAV